MKFQVRMNREAMMMASVIDQVQAVWRATSSQF